MPQSKLSPYVLSVLEEICHLLSEAELSEMANYVNVYSSMLYGFDPRAKNLRTPEWCEKASKRYEGQTEYCCECGASYPRARLKVYGEVFCAKCQAEEDEHKKRNDDTYHAPFIS